MSDFSSRDYKRKFVGMRLGHLHGWVKMPTVRMDSCDKDRLGSIVRREATKMPTPVNLPPDSAATQGLVVLKHIPNCLSHRNPLLQASEVVQRLRPSALGDKNAWQSTKA